MEEVLQGSNSIDSQTAAITSSQFSQIVQQVNTARVRQIQSGVSREIHLLTNKQHAEKPL